MALSGPCTVVQRSRRDRRRERCAARVAQSGGVCRGGGSRRRGTSARRLPSPSAAPGTTALAAGRDPHAADRARRREPPPLAEIVEASVPSALGVEGISAPHPVHHALMLAGHAWEDRRAARRPSGSDRRRSGRPACRPSPNWRARTDAWGIGKIWRTTYGAAAALFDDGRPTGGAPAVRAPSLDRSANAGAGQPSPALAVPVLGAAVPPGPGDDPRNTPEGVPPGAG